MFPKISKQYKALKYGTIILREVGNESLQVVYGVKPLGLGGLISA